MASLTSSVAALRFVTVFIKRVFDLMRNLRTKFGLSVALRSRQNRDGRTDERSPMRDATS